MHASEEGFRYDGEHKVVNYFKVKSQRWFNVWRYVLRRDDTTPALWTSQGRKMAKEKDYTRVYSENYVPPASKVKGGKKRKADYGKENAENEENQPKAKKQNKRAANKYKNQ